MQGALCQAWLADTCDADELDHARLLARLFHAFAENCAGRCGAALKLYHEAQPAFSRAFGVDTPFFMSLQSYMSVAMNDCGEHKQALALQDEVLAKAQARGARGTMFWQDLICSKADTLLALGRFHHAEQLLAELTFGVHDCVPAGFQVKALARMCMSLQGQLRFDEAEPIADRTAAMARQAFGAEHPYTVEACAVQAAGHLARQRPVQALQVLSCVLDAQAPERMQISAKAAVALDMAANAFRLQGAYADEGRVLQLVLSAREAALGSTHDKVVECWERFGLCQERQGSHAQAAACFSRLLLVWMQKKTPPTPGRLRALQGLLRNLDRQGKGRELLPIQRQIAHDLAVLYGKVSMRCVGARTDLGQRLVAAKRGGEACKVFCSLLEDLKPRCVGPLQHARQEAEIGYCHALFQLGQYDLVHRYGSAAYKRMLDRLGSRHHRTARVRDVVEMALLMEFRYEEAKRLAV